MIILFGYTGLLGNYVYQYLCSRNFTVIKISKKEYNILTDSFEKLEQIVTENKPTILINCTNSFKEDLTTQIKINSHFPHQLSDLAIKYQLNLIHISTNGVFLGNKETSYSEIDIPDANDNYGITKRLGENIPFTVIRTSILGESNRSDYYFIEWLKKKSYVKGFSNHYWNGVTCLYLAKYIEYIITTNSYWKGIRHLCDNTIYTKYQLAILVKKIYKLDLIIEKEDSNYKNLSLNTNYKNLFKQPDLIMDLLEQKIFTHKKKGRYINKLRCRFCDHSTTDILHLGDYFGLAGGFLKDSDDATDAFYPLTLSICDHCKYIQCKQVITADELFKKNYFYYSSMIPSLVKHFIGLADWIEAIFPKDTKIIEIGCNDGILLHPLYEKGFHVIGVDPSQTILKVNKDIVTYNNYFDHKTVDEILLKYGIQDLFISCNSFAHIDNMQEIIQNMKRILCPNKGKAIIEVHYSKKIFTEKQFDFIYHEHMGYYTVTSLFNICKLNGMNLTYVEEVPNHGGSLRCLIEMKPTQNISKHIQQWLDKEKQLFEEGFFNKYQEDLYIWRQTLKDKIATITSSGKTIYGYGASGRANTFLHFTGITFDYIIDDAPSKIGSYTPIYNIPIVESKIMYGDNKPDYVFILAWPYADFIMKTHKLYLENGGMFIIPLPEIKEITIENIS